MRDRLYYYKAVVDRIIDGDTFVARWELIPDVCFKATFRMLDINAPEMRGEEAPLGQLSREWLEERIQGKEIIIWTCKTDSFGRWLAKVYLDDVCINGEMITLGYAEPYS